MAGGIGSRFWPMSRTSFPKQFHDVLGMGETLIQMTYRRFLDVCLPENIYIVTNTAYTQEVQKQLPELSEHQIIQEPVRRNTAPCIAYANHKINASNPKARIVVAPSDHLITREEEFAKTVRMALDHSATNQSLITLGILPTRPDTGYGYIQFTESTKSTNSQIKKVKTFTEKPNLELAKEFISSGDFLWNSGIFIWSLESINKAFDAHLPELNDLFRRHASLYNTAEEATKMRDVYTMCENISVDYGILEKAENVEVVKGNFGWSDLGTWGSLYGHINKDDRGNALLAKNTMMVESSGNIVKAPADKLVAIQGLSDHIVIDTGDVLLICPMNDEQKIKQIVTDLKAQRGDTFV